MTHALDVLHAVLLSRMGGDPDLSYSARLFSKGRAKIAQKLGEEAVETVIAAIRLEEDGDREPLVAESADLLYHLLALWAEAGVSPDRVWAELRRRAARSGLEEKASRQRDGHRKTPNDGKGDGNGL